MRNRAFIRRNGCTEELGFILSIAVRGVSLFVGTCRCFAHLSGGAVVVVQHASQPLAPLDWSRGEKAPRLWNDQPIAQSLVITFNVVVGDKIVNGCPL